MEYLRFIFSTFISVLINGFRLTSKNDFKNILIIRLDHLGDMMLTFPAMSKVRKEFINSKITLMTGEWNRDLFFNSPLIDDIIFYNSPAFSRNKNTVTNYKKRISLIKDLRKKKVDLIISFRDDFFTNVASLILFPSYRRDRGTTRIIIKLLSFFHKIKTYKKAISQHELDTNDRIINPLVKKAITNDNYFPLIPDEKIWIDDFYKKYNIKGNKYAIIHPGASWEFKRWDCNNFKEIGEYLFSKYGLRSIIVGSPHEKHLGEKIAENSSGVFINEGFSISIRETVLLIINSKIAICNDSGPMQIASQCGIPTIAIMGPIDVAKFGPRGDKVIVYHKKVECYPCNQTVCKYPSMPCVNLNKVDEIKTGIDQLLLGGSI
jgi:ADP-heptose:LPS heptosyltransferase